MTIRHTIRLVGLSACLAAVSTPALAQRQAQPAPVAPVGPETLLSAGPSGPISLADGVRTAIERSRNVQLAAEDIRASRASVRQARGAFDVSLNLNFLFEHREDPIENTQFFDQERVKRGFAKGLRDGFGEVAKALANQIAQGRGDLPLCPVDQDFSSYTVTLPGSVLPVLLWIILP